MANFTMVLLLLTSLIQVHRIESHRHRHQHVPGIIQRRPGPFEAPNISQVAQVIYVPYYAVPFTSCNIKELQEARNKQLVREFTQELFGNKNISCIDKYVAPAYIQHNPTVADGRDALKAAASQWFSGDDPKTTMDIRRISADGNLVWVHYKDNSEDNKMTAVVDIYRVENDMLQEHWDVIQVLPDPEKSKNPHPLFR